MNLNIKQPDDEVIGRMTAAEALELACRSNPQVLAQLFMASRDPEVTFTVTMNLSFAMKAEVAQDTMKAAGFEVTIPPRYEPPVANEGSEA